MEEIRNWLVVLTAINVPIVGYVYYQAMRALIRRYRQWRRKRDVVGERLRRYTRPSATFAGLDKVISTGNRNAH